MIIDPAYQASGGSESEEEFLLLKADSKFLLPMRIAFMGRDETWEMPLARALKWLCALLEGIAKMHDYKLSDVLASGTPVELESDFDDNSVTLTLLHEGFQHAAITFKKEEI
tara:strand:- start:873 stop:1208 length:336 start_codon:yes stop_codon:yes gene_type:complete